MSNNAHELSNRLLNALDNNYNVVDMHAVNEIISILERINITKELLETTRLGKHVNELRRKTSEPTLARRAKVLVKRWRDLVIPSVTSPGHTGSNRSSAERQVRRLGGTPLTSPALSRQVLSPAVPSPRPLARPAWGGYESDSQDVILVDDDAPIPAPPNPLTHATKPLTPPVKRPLSPESLHDEKKAKRDKKPKKRRGHSRAGTGSETTAIPPATPVVPSPLTAGSTAWTARNGTGHERRRNGTRPTLDSYAALVNRMPAAGTKKVKTTKELLEQIQSRGNVAPASPHSPDVMLIEPDAPEVKVESPLRNGGESPRPKSPEPTYEPLEDEREYFECTCAEEQAADDCPAALHSAVRPATVYALHNGFIPGVNGTRAPVHPHRFAVRPLEDPDRPGLFASVVPLYKYSDYADDYCAKNMSRVPVCAHLPWTEFAPAPPEPSPPPSPPPMRPYPVPSPVKEEPEDDDAMDVSTGITDESAEPDAEPPSPSSRIKLEVVKDESTKTMGRLEPSERLKTEEPSPMSDSETTSEVREGAPEWRPHAAAPPPHRTVERTKALDGAALYAGVAALRSAIPYDYELLGAPPQLSRDTLSSDDAVSSALETAECARDSLGRPTRPEHFAEWHECAQLGSLVALPYVVID